MDVKAALAETRRAYEEAGAPAEAYAYLDDEDFEAWGDPPALTDDMPDPPSELEAPMGTTWIAATHCLFVGGPGTRLYYRAGNPQTRNCYTQNASITWLQRQFATTCRSNGEGIWWVLARVWCVHGHTKVSHLRCEVTRMRERALAHVAFELGWSHGLSRRMSRVGRALYEDPANGLFHAVPSERS